MIYQAQKLINEDQEKLPASSVEAVVSSIKIAQESLDSDDLEILETSAKELESAVINAVKELYTQDPSGANTEVTEPDDIVDAEFEEA